MTPEERVTRVASIIAGGVEWSRVDEGQNPFRAMARYLIAEITGQTDQDAGVDFNSSSILVTIPCPDESTAEAIVAILRDLLRALSTHFLVEVRRGPEVLKDHLYLEQRTRYAAHVRGNLSPGSGIREADMERYRGVCG